MPHILDGYAAITSQVPGRVVALGNIYRDSATTEKRGFFASLLASVVAKRDDRADGWRYIALGDQRTLHILDFTAAGLTARDDFAIADLRVSNLHSDESFLSVAFAAGARTFDLRIHRYQLPNLDSSLLHDPEQMKQVGVMTKAI